MPTYTYPGLSKDEQEQWLKARKENVRVELTKEDTALLKRSADQEGLDKDEVREKKWEIRKRKKEARFKELDAKVKLLDAKKVIGDLTFKKGEPTKVLDTSPLLKKLKVLAEQGVLKESGGK